MFFEIVNIVYPMRTIDLVQGCHGMFNQVVGFKMGVA